MPRGPRLIWSPKGRHDPCVGIRAVPVGEAMMACVLLDHLLLDRGQTGGVRGGSGRVPTRDLFLLWDIRELGWLI